MCWHVVSHLQRDVPPPGCQLAAVEAAAGCHWLDVQEHALQVACSTQRPLSWGAAICGSAAVLLIVPCSLRQAGSCRAGCAAGWPWAIPGGSRAPAAASQGLHSTAHPPWLHQTCSGTAPARRPGSARQHVSASPPRAVLAMPLPAPRVGAPV